MPGAATTMRDALVWDDLRYFLALARAGTLSEAARSLGVNHATVGRRIQALEQACGGKLFIRSGPRYVLSDRGRALQASAADVETSIHHCTRAVAGVDSTIAGIVRVTTTQLLSLLVVAPAALELHRRHPSIALDVVESTRFARLTHQEADLALRMTLGTGRPTGDALLVTRLGAFDWRLAAAPTLLAAHGVIAPRDPDAAIAGLERLPIALYDDDAPGRVGADWLARSGSRAPVVLYASSMYALGHVASQGLAAAFLPEPYAALLGLRCVSPAVEISTVQLLVHPDLRNNPRIRVVREQLVAQAKRVGWSAARPRSTPRRRRTTGR